jgi:hypothetical protein
MTTILVLGPHSHAGCPECGRRVIFFSGQKDAFMSEEKPFSADTTLELKCPSHGTFEVRVDQFRTEMVA